MWCERKAPHPSKFQIHPSNPSQKHPSRHNRNEKRNQFYFPSMPCGAHGLHRPAATGDDVCVWACLVTWRFPPPHPMMSKSDLCFSIRNFMLSVMYLPPPRPTCNLLIFCYFYYCRRRKCVTSHKRMDWIGLRCVLGLWVSAPVLPHST